MLRSLSLENPRHDVAVLQPMSSYYCIDEAVRQCLYMCILCLTKHNLVQRTMYILTALIP